MIGSREVTWVQRWREVWNWGRTKPWKKGCLNFRLHVAWKTIGIVGQNTSKWYLWSCLEPKNTLKVYTLIEEGEGRTNLEVSPHLKEGAILWLSIKILRWKRWKAVKTGYLPLNMLILKNAIIILPILLIGWLVVMPIINKSLFWSIFPSILWQGWGRWLPIESNAEADKGIRWFPGSDYNRGAHSQRWNGRVV